MSVPTGHGPNQESQVDQDVRVTSGVRLGNCRSVGLAVKIIGSLMGHIPQ